MNRNSIFAREWRARFARPVRSGFTLIEMMVVLAITAVLLGIILIPMIQSFNFTRAAEDLAEEQDRGRLLIDQISRDIATGTTIADNDGPAGETIIAVPKFPYTATSFGGYPYSASLYTEIPIYNSRIDIYRPARSGQQVGGAFVNVNTNHIDPTLGAANGQPIFPAAQGATIVRYWVGLRRPLQNDKLTENMYNEPFDGLLMPINGNEDNLYVLYRAEVQPFTLINGTWQYNSNLFKQDPKNPGQPYLADPYFFIQSSNDPNLTANGGAKGQAQRIENWLAASTVVTEEHRFDMIQPVISGAGSSATDKIVSLIQFRPSPISQEPPAGEASVSLGNETNVQSKTFIGTDGNYYVNPNLGLAPDVFRTTMGAWNSAVVSIEPFPSLSTTTYQPAVAPGNTDYLGLDTRTSAAPLPGSLGITEQNLLILYGVANVSSIPQGEVLFDLNQYASSSAGTDQHYNPSFPTPEPHYPLSEAIDWAANTDDPSVPSGVSWLTLPPAIRDEFIPFDYDLHGGQIETAFGINEVGNPKDNPKNADNVPLVSTCGNSNFAYTPTSDPNLTASTEFYDPNFASINEFFNASWSYVTNNPDTLSWLTTNVQSSLLSPGVLQRFVDLRLEPQNDGWASPMDPDPNDVAPLAYYANGGTSLATKKTPWASNWTGFTHVSIVPGSDRVEGPDQTSGTVTNVLYRRVASNPGPNQYAINYTNQPEPPSYSQIVPGLPNPSGQTYDVTTQQWSGAYDPHDFSTAIIQPRYKVGYIEFDSNDPNAAIPVGAVHISYRFQFNRPGDALSVNYDSREVMNVLLTMRSYPQTTNMPNAQTITLQASAPVKNFLR